MCFSNLEKISSSVMMADTDHVLPNHTASLSREPQALHIPAWDLQVSIWQKASLYEITYKKSSSLYM
jgi:hypothetical protein